MISLSESSSPKRLVASEEGTEAGTLEMEGWTSETSGKGLAAALILTLLLLFFSNIVAVKTRDGLVKKMMCLGKSKGGIFCVHWAQNSFQHQLGTVL